ncbi:MAG TPA: hypothetical protein VGN12_23350 [Pirellulales bacterium]
MAAPGDAAQKTLAKYWILEAPGEMALNRHEHACCYLILWSTGYEVFRPIEQKERSKNPRRRMRHNSKRLVRKLREVAATPNAGKEQTVVFQALKISQRTPNYWGTQHGGIMAEESKRQQELEEKVSTAPANSEMTAMNTVAGTARRIPCGLGYFSPYERILACLFSASRRDPRIQTFFSPIVAEAPLAGSRSRTPKSLHINGFKPLRSRSSYYKTVKKCVPNSDIRACDCRSY